MPYPVQHQYMTVIGDCYGGTEKWQFGMRLTDGGVSNEETALAISDDVEAWWLGTGANDYVTLNTHRLVELKVARIGVDGKYPDGEVAYSHFYLPPIAGQVAPQAFANPLPQSTIACTLTTAVPRGLASKGRIFCPPSAQQALGADGRIPEGNAQNIAASVRDFINAINANTVVGNIAIFSRGKGVGTYDPVKNKIIYTYPNPGAFNVVTGVSVGRVVDTQRRRRRSMAESPVVSQLA